MSFFPFHTLIEKWDLLWYVLAGTSIPEDYEPFVSSRLESLDPNSIFVDVGAGVGSYACRFSRHFKKVIALEPDPLSYYVLNVNKFINNLDNLEIYPVGALNEDTYRYLEGKETIAPWQQALLKNQQKQDLTHGRMPFKAVRLDGLISHADIIKIDTEGAEAQVLMGSKELLKNCKPKLVVEIHSFIDATLEEQIDSYLKQYSYMPELLNRSDKVIWKFYASNL